MKGKKSTSVDWGYGKPTTIHFSVDPTTGEKYVYSQEEIDAMVEKHEEEHLRRYYEQVALHHRATMMIDYRVATASPNTRAHWLREQRRYAIRIYQP